MDLRPDRPLGASFADYLCRSPPVSGIGFGKGRTAILLTIAVTGMVVHLSVSKQDIQPHLEPAPV